MKLGRALAAIATVGILVMVPAALADRDDYETPKYKVVKNDGAFEIRDYPKIVVASAPMDSNNGAFMQLFRYISGKNEAEQKIEMTTPVIIDDESDDKHMSFVVPADVAAAGAPKANNPNIEITTREAARYAVYRFSGIRSRAKEEQAQKLLMEWIEKQKLEVIGTMEKASYDPPMTLPAKRRNEVMIKIKK
ncbi:SOUL family heme-binding protein [Sulfuriroseicoccus oceanibius]|uniref:Heme-binding protein n=1 Tax=Sulfuriroseicoccus oceanibius TaxID=2707525 RepID=A0A6B3LBF9_9BACT|nr:heme-binding protein [Sulfuriroseicoccus oceanibius]QQL45994.1 heme-binding protein [Sulfuriroseicoccus oceanibius]